MSSAIVVVIATYGEQHWRELAVTRALPSIGDVGELCVHQPNGTRASSLNHGAELAGLMGAEWLLFLDADDEFAPGYVGAMRRALEQHRDDGTRNVLFTPAVQQIRKGRPGRPFFYKEVDLTLGNWLVIGTMISRALFQEIGGFREHPHGLEDFNLWMRAHRAGAKVVKVPDAVYVQHMNPQSEHHKFQRRRQEYMVAYHAAVADV